MKKLQAICRLINLEFDQDGYTYCEDIREFSKDFCFDIDLDQDSADKVLKMVEVLSE
jgi:hypothetical protein